MPHSAVMTNTASAPTVLHAAASRRGTRDHNMDAAAVFEASNGLVAAAVVDGIGNDRSGAEIMRDLARYAVRIGANKGALAGVLGAAAYIEDPGVEDYQPDGVIVLALAEPGEPTQLGWVGDSHAYSWDGTTLHRRTTPHTMGEFLRQNGDADLAPQHDNWIRVSLASATPATVARSEAPAGELVLLVSDGLDEVDLEELAREHHRDPQALAEAVVAAAQAGDDGYRDDATAIVLMPAVIEP